MKISEVAVDAAAISTSSKITAGGGTAGLIGFATSVNWLGIGGFLIAVIGLLVNLYFQRRRDKREHAEHLARTAAIKDKCAT
jgi:heme exporter protein D